MGKFAKKKRNLYTDEILNKALHAIKCGTPINTASRIFKIPRSTLHNKVINKHNKSKPGRYTVLNTEEEENLVKWINFMCNLGRLVTKDHIINSVALLVKKSNKPNPFSDGRPGRNWYEGFLNRHRDSQKKLRENARLVKTPINEESMKKWFKNVKNCLEKENLDDIESSRVFSVSEISLSMNPKRSSDLADNDEPNERIKIGERKKVSVFITGNAAGHLAPPMIVFNRDRISDDVRENLPQGWSVGASESDECITAELFYDYVESYFYPWLLNNSIKLPIILFLDECAAYLTQLLSEFCTKHEIAIVIFPPNTTRFMQPIDISFILSLKKKWNFFVNNYKIENNISSLKEADVSSLLQQVFKNINAVKILGNGFRSRGLYPFSEDINYAKLRKIQQKQIQGNEKNKIDKVVTSDRNKKSSNRFSLLEEIEKFIDPSTLESFRCAVDDDKWTGKIEDTSLFYAWKRIMFNDNYENVDAVQTVKEIITKNNAPPVEYISTVANSGFKINDNQENLQPMDNIFAECSFNTDFPYQPLHDTNRILEDDEYIPVKIIVVQTNDLVEDNTLLHE